MRLSHSDKVRPFCDTDPLENRQQLRVPFRREQRHPRPDDPPFFHRAHPGLIPEQMLVVGADVGQAGRDDVQGHGLVIAPTHPGLDNAPFHPVPFEQVQSEQDGNILIIDGMVRGDFHSFDHDRQQDVLPDRRDLLTGCGFSGNAEALAVVKQMRAGQRARLPIQGQPVLQIADRGAFSARPGHQDQPGRMSIRPADRDQLVETRNPAQLLRHPPGMVNLVDGV